jgi:hypothetical protein
MGTKIVIRNGTVHAVYDDRTRPILEALGILTVKRASEVEFDAATGEWVACLATTGEEIARGKNRGDVIADEVRYLESQL